MRFTLKATDALRLRVGQWKVPYNRERVDSSGKQQFAERSIATPWFTLDRQQGGAVTDLEGGYLQAGYFFHALWSSFPKPLEVAVRYAQVDPNTTRERDLIRETTLAFNWFFNGHRNKLTLDLSRLQDQAGEPGRRNENRVRLQWDISF